MSAALVAVAWDKRGKQRVTLRRGAAPAPNMNTKETTDTSEGSARERGRSVRCADRSLPMHVTLLIRQAARGEDDNTRHICASALAAPAAASPLPSSCPRAPRCISGIETCLKTVSSDQFPGHRQEGGGETRRDEEAQHCKVRGGSQEGPDHVRHYRPPERKKKKEKKKQKKTPTEV